MEISRYGTSMTAMLEYRGNTDRCIALGRNGYMKCLGISADTRRDLGVVELSPINTKTWRGSAQIDIPIDDIDDVIDLLTHIRNFHQEPVQVQGGEVERVGD